MEPRLGQERPKIKESSESGKFELEGPLEPKTAKNRMHYDLRAPRPAQNEAAKAGATRDHLPGAPMGITPSWPAPHGSEFSAEPAQHSSNSRQRTPYSRQKRMFGS